MIYHNGIKYARAYYKGSQIRLKGVMREPPEVIPQLTAPTISLDGDTLTMTATDDRTEEFVIFVDGVETATVKDLITFTIEGTTYYAEDGMTWGEWCESDYNTAGYYVKNGGAIHLDDDTYVAKTAAVSSTDEIEASQVYSLETLGGSYD